MKKRNELKKIILPNQKINIFITSTMLLGIISGSIFLTMLNKTDKENIISRIQSFFELISKGNINSGLALKNSLIINYLFIGLIWILGLSMIGIIINILLTYIKGFITGFSIASIFLTYSYKGIPASFIYLIFSQIINIIIIIILSIYSIMFSYNLLKIIINKKGKLILKKYIIILMLLVILSFISSLSEAYLFPRVLKLIIKIYT